MTADERVDGGGECRADVIRHGAQCSIRIFILANSAGICYAAPMKKTADLSGIDLPVVTRCENCRFSQTRSFSKELSCLCPRQSDWSDRAATDDFTYASVVREYYCRGNWWELKMPEPPRGLRRMLYWLRRQA